MRSLVLRPWIGFACAAFLLAGCGGEEQRGPTVQQQEFAEELAPEETMAEEAQAPAPEEGKAAEPDEMGGPDAAQRQAEALAAAGEPRAEAKPLERLPGPSDSEVPWLPDGELIEVERLGDPEEPGQDMSRTVFEVKATPEATLASYEQVLVKGGWKTEYMDPETLIGYQGNTMIMASVIRGSVATRLEVFVTPKPEGIEDDGGGL